MAHSTVTYVEPNLHVGFSKNGDWRIDDGLEIAPRLEDYCIGLNIEVEVSSRDSQSTQNQGNKDVIIMQWNSDNKSSVNFMAGTKIGGYDMDNQGTRHARIGGGQENLTTYYADLYVGDLIDFGTTEMIGIKSVNIEYEKSCVPVITIQFTDVRGISLFQPTELSRINSYDGIKGLNKDNIAQSFFQCFFKMPLPKFTIYIKGFYGNPVSYVVMCDKFDTNFNSETGDFDVTARFIGYSYSFLTDVSFDAIYAAPYSDYEGKRYWEENVKNGRFYILDKMKQKMEMPTLFEVLQDFRNLNNESDKDMESTTIVEEDFTHEDEIDKLEKIKVKYQDWYSKLYNVLINKYGKRYVFDFRENNTDADWYRILILTNNSTKGKQNLSEDYTQFSESFKEANDDLYAAIEEFNQNANNYKKLDNISQDFTSYTRQAVFNNCYVNRNTRKIEFNGFSRDFKGNKTQIVNRLFHKEVSSDVANNENGNTIKEFTLSTIYGDGVNQYVYAYFIEVNYSDIKRRINILRKDAAKNPQDKEKELKRKEHNKYMLSKMNWYPSIENFTRIMMAHLETLMMMMYKVAEKCSDRTAKELGISIGEGGEASDVNFNSKVVPPFPRITRSEIDSDNITRVVDTWVGNYFNTKGFEEAEIVNGLFNAVDLLQNINSKNKENNLDSSYNNEEEVNLLVKHPLTSYDFFLSEQPYGIYSDVDNNPNVFAGKVAIRMFGVMALNYLKKEYPKSFSNESDFINTLGKIEAENFYEYHHLSKKLIKLLGSENDNSTLTSKAIIDCVTNGKGINDETIPWLSDNKSDNLFNSKMELDKYTTSYSTKNKTRIYPIQDVNFNSLETTLMYFNKDSNSIEADNESIILDWIDIDANAETLINTSKNNSCFGSMYITENYRKIADALASSNSSPNNSYKEMYDLILKKSVFNKEDFKKLIYEHGVFRHKRGVSFQEYKYLLENENPAGLPYEYVEESGEEKKTRRIYYTFDKDKLPSYVSEVENRNIQSWFFTECRGFNKTNGKLFISNEKSFSKTKDAMKIIESVQWKYGNLVEKKMAFFLMGLECIDYKILSNYLEDAKTFVYMPKLAALQIGAALCSLDNIGVNITETALINKIFLPRTFKEVIKYLNLISDTTRIAYIKYFKNWVSTNNASILSTLFNSNENDASETQIGQNIRVLYKESSVFSANLANDLMSCICMVKGNTYHYKRNEYPKLETSVATKYLDSFLSRLRELCNETNNESQENTPPTLTKSPDKITEDMKIELYRYLKLLYDKWVPVYDKNTWKYETFFDVNEEAKIKDNNGGGGHLFHFIDSYYNKIGDKLLINPSKLCEKLDAALENNDTNTMMLGFLADIFAQNKCMLLCLQNFLDLGDKDNMNTMFEPISYNEMKLPRKHPDFVVVYPYEPSKNLNIDNSEFANDSFMLNDEFDTPVPIKSRSDNNSFYQIPAFGVSYGKQYQSYFKKISVGMKSPIATQQAILAKHSILNSMNGNKAKTTVAQDLYDIYTTQSFTCTVEMMGCAWIQPLMYFVLTNVPMFRGSYLILKVKHRITPGDMVTEFTGTRMCNISNRLIEDIFTDEDFDESYEQYQIERSEKLADINNNCDYKVYPLFASDGQNLPQDKLKTSLDIMNKLHDDYGFSLIAAAGICGNIAQESMFEPTACNIDNNKHLVGGLFQWNDKYYNLTHFLNNDVINYGQTASTRAVSSLEELKTKLSKKKENSQELFYDIDYQLNYMSETIGKSKPGKMSKEIINGYSSPEIAASKFAEFYEICDMSSVNARESYARQCYDYYIKESKKKSEPNNELELAFFNAINKTAINTPSIGIELTNKVSEKYEFIKYYKKNFGERILTISQRNGKKDKLPRVFDMILNSRYFDYVQTLYWCYNKSALNAPLSLHAVLSKNPKAELRRIYLMDISNLDHRVSFKFASTINKTFLFSIKKKYGSVPNKEVPQLKSNDIFEGIEINDCNDMVREEIINNGIKIDEGGMVSNWNAEKAAEWLVCATSGKTSQQICAFAVQQAVIAGGIPFERISKYKNSCNGYRVALNLEGTKHWEFIASGTTLTSQISGLNPQVGDIIGMTKGTNYNEPGHVCMYCRSKYGWVSDYQQGNAPYPYGKDKGIAKYWVVRYKGGSSNTTQKPSKCYKGKCLNNCSA